MFKSIGCKAASLFSCLALTGTAAYGPAVLAQGEPEALVEEIIVTAQKREQTLAEVPMSITAISGEYMRRRQADNFEDFVVMVPGLSLESTSRGGTRLTLRGINTGGVASTVATYFGDVVFGSSTGLANGAVLASDFDTFDMDRIEILRGPQGTLYGASSLAGVFKYVPNEVKLDEFEGNLDGTVETIENGDLGYSLAGAVNVPVNDKFGFRAAAFLRSDDGFIDSLGNNPIPSLTDPTMFTSNTRVAEKINAIDTTGGRITALIAPSDSFSIELMALGQKIETDEANVIDADPDTLEPLYGTLAQSSYHPSGTDTEYQVSSVSLDWDLGGFSIESISSYTTLDSNALLDADTLLGPTLTFLFGDPVTRPLGSIQTTDVTTDKFSQEFRLISADSDTFEWLLGAYYTDEESLILQHISAVESGTETIPTDLPEIAFATISSDYKELAFFANATWYLTPQFEISLGARSSSNDQNASQIILSPVLGDSTPPDAASSDSPFTWSFAPRFKINDETSIYARVATGFRPGGPNVLPLNPPPGTPSTFDSDTLTSYEVGIKTDGSGALVSLDFALYYLDWEDIQLFVRINDIGVNTNGETAESKGAEIAAKFAPTDRLTVSLTAAYTDAKLTANTDPPNEIPVVGGMDGDPLPYVPEWSFGLSGDYEWPVMGDATAYVGGTYGYTGDRPSAFNNRDSNGNIREADAYNLVNLRGGLETDRWSVEVFGKNLTDARGSNSTGGAGSLPNGATSIGLIQPRTYGVSVGMKF